MSGNNLKKLAPYHPVVIEGMGAFDQRDPAVVIKQIVTRLQQHWRHKTPSKPLLIMTQGDPVADKGIAAITFGVAKSLQRPRGLVCLDESMASYHARDADRRQVTIEVRYSQLTEYLKTVMPDSLSQLEQTIAQQIKSKNAHRKKLQQPPLKSYFYDFACLQEVTKVACAKLCEEITLIHTATEIYPFSVTSFYTVSKALGLIHPNNIVSYASHHQNN